MPNTEQPSHTNQPNYRSLSFLTSQVEAIVDFYYPACIDNDLGGYINQFRDDGSIYDDQTKHLVGTCRFVYVFATAAMMLNKPEYLDAARHGIRFLQKHQILS